RARVLAVADPVRAHGQRVQVRLPAGLHDPAGADAGGVGGAVPEAIRVNGGHRAQRALPRGKALVGWRLLALVYDALPVLALWLLVSALFTAGFTVLGHHDARETIRPFSLLSWLLWIACWLATAAYARSEEHTSELQSREN